MRPDALNEKSLFFYTHSFFMKRCKNLPENKSKILYLPKAKNAKRFFFIFSILYGIYLFFHFLKFFLLSQQNFVSHLQKDF